MYSHTFGALLFFSWAMPLHFLPWVSWHNEVMAFAAAICLTAGLLKSLRLNGTGLAIKVPLLALPMVFLAGIVMIQTISGAISFGGDALILIFYFAICFLMIVIGYESAALQPPSCGNNMPLGGAVIQLAGLLVIGGLFSTIVALVQVLDVWDTSNWILRMPVLRRPGANLGQPNQMATLILFAIASMVYLFETHHLSALTTLLLMGTFIGGLVVTESRTGAISLFLLAIWWIVKKRQISSRISTSSVVIGLALFALGFWFWPIFFGVIQAGQLSYSDESMQMNLRGGTRLVVWPQLWYAVMQRPWFGWGIRQVAEAHNAVLDQYSESEPFTYAHNIFLDSALGVGLPITIVFFGVAAVWFWRRLKSTTDILSWYCLAVVLPFALHSMLEFPFAYAYLLIPVMLLLGALEARIAPGNEVRLQWQTALASWIIMTGAMAWSAVEYMGIEEDFRIARFESARIGQTPSEYERPQIFLLTQLAALLEGARVIPTPGMSDAKIALMRNVALRFPWPATQNRYALSLALNGNSTEATRQLAVIRAMHGQRHYANIKANWTNLVHEKYPQLSEVVVP